MSALPNIKKIIKTAVIARSGIYQYGQNELSMFGLKPEDAPEKKDIYNVYRPSVVLVENKDKFTMMPLTNEHPDEFLTNENWKEFIAGYTGENIKDEHNNEIDEITLKTSIAVIDEDAINELISGKKEVSCAYYGMFKFENGISPKGEPYDIIMFGVDEEANHLALCQRARGGETVKIIDSKGGHIMGNFVSGLWHSAKKLILGVKDADLGQFRAIIEDVVKNKASLSDEEITNKIQSLQNMISDIPESEDKQKLSRFIEDFPKGIKEKDEETAQKAGELITSLFEKLDTESMESVPETPSETETTNETETVDQGETTHETQEETNDQGTETETETTTETEDQGESQETSETTTEETNDSPITPEQMEYITGEIMTLLKNTFTEDCFKKTKDSEESEDKEESGTQDQEEEEDKETEGAKDSMHNVDITSTQKSDPVEEWLKRKTGGK